MPSSKSTAPRDSLAPPPTPKEEVVVAKNPFDTDYEPSSVQASPGAAAAASFYHQMSPGSAMSPGAAANINSSYPPMMQSSRSPIMTHPSMPPNGMGPGMNTSMMGVMRNPAFGGPPPGMMPQMPPGHLHMNRPPMPHMGMMSPHGPMGNDHPAMMMPNVSYPNGMPPHNLNRMDFPHPSTSVGQGHNQPPTSMGNQPPIFMSHQCALCMQAIGPGEDRLDCYSGCNGSYHRVCVGLAKSAFDLFIREPLAEWACDTCISTRQVPYVKSKPVLNHLPRGVAH